MPGLSDELTLYPHLDLESLALDTHDLKRLKLERQRRLKSLEIPVARILGFALVTLAMALHNRYILPEAAGYELAYASVVLVYCALSWALIVLLQNTRVPASEIFLALDLVPWAAALYLSGADRSWLYPMMVMRAVDQAGTRQGRVLLFGFLSSLAYVGMLGLADHHGILDSWEGGLTKAGLLLVASFYISLATRPVERMRDRVRAAIRLARASVRELGEHQEELRLLSTRLQAVQESERRRISGELHDELGQLLTVLKLELAWLEERLQGAELDKVESMVRHVDMTIDTVRRLARQLRPKILDELGLRAGIDSLARELCDRTGIDFVLDSQWSESELSDETKTAVFRICQEGLTNVIRHARARRVEIRLLRFQGQLRLLISDDGRGMTTDSLIRSRSLGLAGVRERARALNGRFEIVSRPERGTTLEIILPVG